MKRKIDGLLFDRVLLVAGLVLVHVVVLTDLLLCLFLNLVRDWALVTNTVEWVVIGRNRVDLLKVLLGWLHLLNFDDLRRRSLTDR